MSTVGHLNEELLSAYLDHEIAVDERKRFEQHLEACEACSRDLADLRRVVGRLRRLDRLAPSPTLDQFVARRVALEAERRTFLDRIEDGLSIFQRQSTTLFLFAMVVALGSISMLFVSALDRQRNSTVPVIFEDPLAPAEPASPGPSGAAPEVEPSLAPVFVWTGSNWTTGSSRQIPASPNKGEPFEITIPGADWDSWRAKHPELDQLPAGHELPALIELSETEGPVLLLRPAATTPAE